MAYPEEDGKLHPLSHHPVMWRYASEADTVETLINAPRVKTWRLTTGRRQCVVKFTPAQRFMEAPDQCKAESKAAFLLSGDHGDIAALLAVPLQTIYDPTLGVFTATPYAGVTASYMSACEWRDHSPQQMEKLCKTLAASLLLTQLIHQHFGIMHRDIKLDNITYNEEHDFFVLIDYGACCNVDLSDWFGVRDLRYLDRQMGCYCPEADTYAGLTAEGLKFSTFPSLDVYLTGLAVAYLFGGRVPPQLDPLQYKGNGCYNERAHHQAVYDFCWSTSPEAAAMPEQMRSFLLQLLAPIPEDRCSVNKALQHPWLQEEVPRVLAALAAAAPAWQDMLHQLREDFSGKCSTSSTKIKRAESYSSSSSVRSSASSSDNGSIESTNSSAQSPTTPAGGSSPKLSISGSVTNDRSSNCSSFGVDEPAAAAAAVQEAAAEPAASNAATPAPEPVHVMLLVVTPEAPQLVPAHVKVTTDTAVQVDGPADDNKACHSHRELQQYPGGQEGKHGVKVGCLSGLIRNTHRKNAANQHNNTGSSSSSTLLAAKALAKKAKRHFQGVLVQLGGMINRMKKC